MQSDEQHAQGIQLRFVEYRKELAAVEQNARAEIIQFIYESNGGGDENESKHQPRPRLVYVTQQPIERYGEADEKNLAEKPGHDSETEKGIVRQNVRSGRGGVSMNNELAGNVEETKWPRDYHRQIHGAGDAGCFLRWMHRFSPNQIGPR